MAAQEYYFGTQGVHELSGQHPPSPCSQDKLQSHHQHSSSPSYPPRPQYPSCQTPPPSYSAYPPKSAQQYSTQQYSQQYPTLQYPTQQHSPRQYPTQQRYPAEKPQQYSSHLQYPPVNQQQLTAPYPTTPPVSIPTQHRPQPGYLGAPLQPFRSHSQPARVRFADQNSDSSTDLGETDSSDSARRPQHRPRRHRPHSQDPDSEHSDTDRNRHRERTRTRTHHKRHRHPRPRETKLQEKEHKTRDTFLGAGAGTIIGDALFPGLGTAAGLLLGGYGGRKYAERGASEDAARSGRRRRRTDSWEE